MSSPKTRPELLEAALRAFRRLGVHESALNQARAERLGLAATDIDGLELLADEGAMSVGRLAELTGLTTGSATRMVDRLEQAGYVRRVADPVDRRRVNVELVPARADALTGVREPLEQALRSVVEPYGDVELELIVDFVERSIVATASETARLRGTATVAEAEGGAHEAPLAGARSGRLVFISGAPSVVIRSDPSLVKELYRARFDGPVPRMRVRDGVVTLKYGRFSWFDWRFRLGEMSAEASVHWRRDRGEIALTPAVPWTIELRAGASRLSGDLRGIRLESFVLGGGASKVDLRLGAPAGRVGIKIEGGVNDVSIRRPLGTAALLRVNGGANSVVLDGQRGRGYGSGDVLESPDAGRAADRYEIEIAGGANRVMVEAK